jgi:hypothetical protein
MQGKIGAPSSPLKNSDLRESVLLTGIFVATVLLSEGRRYTRIACVLAPRFRPRSLDSRYGAVLQRTARFLLGVIGFSVVVFAASSSRADGFPAKGPYFLVDDRVVEDRWHVERGVVPLERHTRNPVLVKKHPWEGNGAYAGSVLRDPRDGLFKMWYGVFHEHNYFKRLPFSYNACYAESRDGIVWERPSLGVFDHQGSKENNIIRLGREKTQQIDVELRPRALEPGPAFVAIHNEKGGVFVSTSDDGKAFRFTQEKSAVPYHSDTHNNFVYDEVRDRWLMFVRPKAYAGAGLKNVGRRRVAVKESTDLKAWTKERTVLVPDENDPDHFYGMTVFRCGDLFFGALQLYETKHHHIDLELTWSPDGYRWSRLPQRERARWLSHGPDGEWDDGMVLMADAPLRVDDELWFYYGGTDVPHNSFGNAAIGIARTRSARLVSLHAGEGRNGRVLTRPFVVAGDLSINARVTGSLQVSVHTADDDPLPGWSREECAPLRGDALEAPARWGGRGLGVLRGQQVRLRFYLDGATLYAFDMSHL